MTRQVRFQTVPNARHSNELEIRAARVRRRWTRYRRRRDFSPSRQLAFHITSIDDLLYGITRLSFLSSRRRLTTRPTIYFSGFAPPFPLMVTGYGSADSWFQVVSRRVA